MPYIFPRSIIFPFLDDRTDRVQVADLLQRPQFDRVREAEWNERGARVQRSGIPRADDQVISQGSIFDLVVPPSSSFPFFPSNFFFFLLSFRRAGRIQVADLLQRSHA